MKQLEGKLPMTTLSTEPAFPVNGATSWYPGMTMRDYFAAQVLAVLLDRIINTADLETWRFWAAEEAYKAADVMMEARES